MARRGRKGRKGGKGKTAIDSPFQHMMAGMGKGRKGKRGRKRGGKGRY